MAPSHTLIWSTVKSRGGEGTMMGNSAWGKCRHEGFIEGIEIGQAAGYDTGRKDGIGIGAAIVAAVLAIAAASKWDYGKIKKLRAEKETKRHPESNDGPDQEV